MVRTLRFHRNDMGSIPVKAMFAIILLLILIQIIGIYSLFKKFITHYIMSILTRRFTKKLFKKSRRFEPVYMLSLTRIDDTFFNLASVLLFLFFLLLYFFTF